MITHACQCWDLKFQCLLFDCCQFVWLSVIWLILTSRYYDNAYYAQIGGITTQEMNKLELDFLFLVNFRLQVTVSVFESYCSHLEREVALGGGYQIEKTLKSICSLDGESHNSHRKSGQKALAGSWNRGLIKEVKLWIWMDIWKAGPSRGMRLWR